MTDEEQTHHQEIIKANWCDSNSRFEVRSDGLSTQLVLRRPTLYDTVRFIVKFALVAGVIAYFVSGGRTEVVFLIVALFTIVILVGTSLTWDKMKHLPHESVQLIWRTYEQILEAPLSRWTGRLGEFEALGMKYAFLNGANGNGTIKIPPIECLYIFIQGQSHLLYAGQTTGMLNALEKFAAASGLVLLEPGPNQSRHIRIDSW
jgi:hypothetical protein